MAIHPSVTRAISWSTVDVIARYGLSFLVLILLARILSPADYGLMAMLTLFVAVASILIDSGFSLALIQRQQATATDESSVFFFTLIIGLMLALTLCAAAPWIASFYGYPTLEPMTYWMAFNLFLSAFGAIHSTLLAKKLDFKTLMKVGVSSTLVSGSVALIMAKLGWGVWSLVGQALSATVVTNVALWILHPWRPIWVLSFTSLRTFFKFGGFLLWTRLLYVLHANLYSLLIGKLHSVHDVGIYLQAQRLQQVPVNALNGIVGRVAFPIFSASANDKEKLARGVRKAMISVVFVTAPLMVTLIILAEPLVLLLLGEKWLPSAPVMQVLAVTGLMLPLNSVNVSVLNAQGHSALNARIQLIKLSIAITLLLLTSPYGILAIAYGQALASILVFFVNAHYTKTLLNYGSFAQLRDVYPYFLACIPMVLCILGTQAILTLPLYFELPVALILCAATYLLTCKLAKLEAFDYFVWMISKR